MPRPFGFSASCRQSPTPHATPAKKTSATYRHGKDVPITCSALQVYAAQVEELPANVGEWLAEFVSLPTKRHEARMVRCLKAAGLAVHF